MKTKLNHYNKSGSLILALALIFVSSCRQKVSSLAEDQASDSYKIFYLNGGIQIRNQQDIDLAVTIEKFESVYTYEESKGSQFSISDLVFKIGEDTFKYVAGSYNPSDLTLKASKNEQKLPDTLGFNELLDLAVETKSKFIVGDHRKSTEFLNENIVGKKVKINAGFSLISGLNGYHFKSTDSDLAIMISKNVSFNFWSWGKPVIEKMKDVSIGTKGILSGQVKDFNVHSDGEISLQIENFDFTKTSP